MEKMLIGIGFYRRDQYPLLLETANDRDKLEDTYDEWLNTLKKGLKRFKSKGIKPIKVDVDMNELLAFCKEYGLENNGETRSQFFAQLLQQGRWEKFKTDL